MKWFAWFCVFMLVAAVLFECSSAANQKKDSKVGQVKNAAAKSKSKTSAKHKKPVRGRKNKGRRRDGEEDDGEDGELEGDDGTEDDDDYSCFDPCGCFGWGGSNNARRHKRRNMKNRMKNRNKNSRNRKH
ncbi:hypothetical protein M3Y97_00984100 [Aphelenchoides bicaudatus]|nr:hypothetical protein M3Y97_00984100 [Aphelenchoides bicaudatus]